MNNTNNTKTYLITGGAGFIGSNFLKYLSKKEPESKIVCLDKLTYAGNLRNLESELKKPNFTFIKGDICDKSVVKKIFQEYNPEIIVNFAAETHVDRSIDNPQLFLQTNILGTQNLLENAKTFWQTGKAEGKNEYTPGSKFVQISTDEVYGSLGKTGKFSELTSLDPRSPYSASKTGADLLVNAYFHTFHLPINITRCSNNYGPYQFPEKLIPLMINNLLEGKKLPVYGTGENVRDWIYVDDHSQAIHKVIENGKLGEVYNIGGNCEKQNIEIVKLLISTVRTLSKDEKYAEIFKDKTSEDFNDDLIEYVTDRPGHDFRYAIDHSKISNQLNYSPKTRFEEGIVDTVRWYLDNLKWVKEITSGDYKDYYKKMYDGR